MKVNDVYCKDALTGLKQLRDESVDAIITSPPYWSLRDYHVKEQLGLEQDFHEYIAKLLEIFKEGKRVLKSSGICWVNLGDCYGGKTTNSDSGKREKGVNSLLPDDLTHFPKASHQRGKWDKCLMGIPERFMLGMLEQGWILRNKIIWRKPNHMPSSVKDRFANSWEYLFMFVKARYYYFNIDAVREPRNPLTIERAKYKWKGQIRPDRLHPRGKVPDDVIEQHGILNHASANVYVNRSKVNTHPLGKNPSDFLEIAPQHFKGAHFEVFPERLVEKPIKSSPKLVCTKCGKPKPKINRPSNDVNCYKEGSPNILSTNSLLSRAYRSVLCQCNGESKPALILDPFMGAGTTGVVAKKFGRDYLGFDLNPEYVKIAKKRIAAVQAPAQ